MKKMKLKIVSKWIRLENKLNKLKIKKYRK